MVSHFYSLSVVNLGVVGGMMGCIRVMRNDGLCSSDEE